jgi:ATP-dependent DNA helicase RecQ
LLYFGELVTENCGNCDICKNPPLFRWNHTCSKALSAIIRLQETEPLPNYRLLHGSKTLIFMKKIPKPKTYGVGIDLSW